MITEWFVPTSSAFSKHELEPKTNHENRTVRLRFSTRVAVCGGRQSAIAKTPAPDPIRVGAGFRNRSCSIESQTITRIN
jgi:hypothetical protein